MSGGFGPGIASRGNTANTFVGRGVPGSAFVGRNLNRNGGSAGRNFGRNGRFAFNGRHVHHRFGFIPGFGYGYYWYDDTDLCWAWTDYGYVNLCSDIGNY